MLLTHPSSPLPNLFLNTDHLSNKKFLISISLVLFHCPSPSYPLLSDVWILVITSYLFSFLFHSLSILFSMITSPICFGASFCSHDNLRAPLLISPVSLGHDCLRLMPLWPQLPCHVPYGVLNGLFSIIPLPVSLFSFQLEI